LDVCGLLEGGVFGTKRDVITRILNWN